MAKAKETKNHHTTVFETQFQSLRVIFPQTFKPFLKTAL